jgi:hypothetical protein
MPRLAPVHDQIRASGRRALVLVTAVALAGALLAIPDDAAASSTGAAGATAAGNGSGRLTVLVTGLPRGQQAAGRLRGPGVSRSVRSWLTLRNARPGIYRLTLSTVRIYRRHASIKAGAHAIPTRRTIKVRVRAGKSTTLNGAYGSIVNPGVQSLNGGVIGVAGDPGDPSAVVFEGQRTFKNGAILSIPPGGPLPHGLLSRVTSVTPDGPNTTVTLQAATVYDVAPTMSFDIPLSGDEAEVVERAAKVSCGGTSGLSPYRRIKDISISGGWNTVRVLGRNVKVGVQAQAHFTVEAGVDANASVGVSCSFKTSVSASGMAGPIPVTAAIDGTIDASISAGAKLSAGGSVRVDAGAKTYGIPPVMTWAPDVNFSNARFTFAGQAFAEATAGIGVDVRLGIGNDNIASATVGIGSGVKFAARPGSCSFDAHFGQFFAGGKVLGFDVQTPRTPTLFSKNLWRNACRPTGGGGGTGSTPPAGPTPPPDAGGSPSGPAPGGSAPPIGGPPTGSGTTYAETTGGAANTWTNYTNAGGTQGPTIPGNATVQISCKVQGFRVADGNTWWYRVASSPWNNAYYVSADAFYNNGATSGPLAGTPFVDPAVPDCAGSAPSPPSPPAPQTWAETTGGVAHTWTNYTNAGGTQGPSIGSNQTVAISCKLQGFRVADGNTWWYRIASAPWNDAYYVSADAFYNNGATSGTLHGTPFVDPAVANC